MEAYLADWLNLFVRWLHMIAGIAWIGSSFYFIWLDDHLEAPDANSDRDKGVGGEVWAVHGGGFYHAQKYKVAPSVLPTTLHWFKWEAYTTWLSGMFLLVLVYWYGAEVYLIDPAVAGLTPPLAVGIAAGFIVAGWLIYDLLCKSPLARHDGMPAFCWFCRRCSPGGSVSSTVVVAPIFTSASCSARSWSRTCSLSSSRASG